MKTRLLALILVSAVCTFAQSNRRITKIVSSASGSTTIAPNSLASIYGENLTDTTEAAGDLPLPTQLAGIAVVVNGATLSGNAQIIFASPTQINFVMPENAQPGMDMVSVVAPEIIYATSPAAVDPVAPSLFSADGTGTGAAAGFAIRTVIPTHFQGMVDIFHCDATTHQCSALPLDTGVDAPLTLVLFGTGLRGGKKVTATIGGQSFDVDYAGPQPQYPGLDQVNIPLGLSLRGAGLVDVVVTVDGKASNPVQISVL